MKPISTLLIFLFAGLLAFANPNSGRLSVTIVGNKNVHVMIDNQRYSDNSIMINELASGHHSIKIYRENNDRRNNGGWGRNNRNNNLQLVYSTSFYVKAGHHVDILVNRFGKALVDERLIVGNGRYGDVDYDDYDQDDRRWDNRNDNYFRPVSDASFASIIQGLRREYVEDSRVRLAKQIINDNYFTSEQVKQVVQLFSFENNKLDLAKYAYNKTTNKGNYFIIYDVFSFRKSKEELADYIQRYR